MTDTAPPKGADIIYTIMATRGDVFGASTVVTVWEDSDVTVAEATTERNGIVFFNRGREVIDILSDATDEIATLTVGPPGMLYTAPGRVTLRLH